MTADWMRADNFYPDTIRTGVHTACAKSSAENKNPDAESLRKADSAKVFTLNYAHCLKFADPVKNNPHGDIFGVEQSSTFYPDSCTFPFEIHSGQFQKNLISYIKFKKCDHMYFTSCLRTQKENNKRKM